MSPDNLPTYISLNQAATRYGVNVAVLRRAVESGIMRAVRTPEGRILVASKDIPTLSKMQFEHLQKQGISISSASQKYNVPHSTLRSWTKQGHIKVLNPDKRRQGRATMLNESDVAYHAVLYHRLKDKRGQVTGMRIFATQ